MWTEKGERLQDDTCVSGWMMAVPFTGVCDIEERAGGWSGTEIMDLARDMLLRGAWERVSCTNPELMGEKDTGGPALESVGI